MLPRHLTFPAALARFAVLAAVFAAACSSNSSTTPSSSTITTTTPAAAPCAFAIGSNSANANGGGDTLTVNVGATASTCTWTAVSNSSFITVKSATGTGDGSVTLTIAPNPGGARTGTVTIAGKTFTVNQSAGLVAAFDMIDPAAQAGATTECRFRSLTSQPTTCTLRSNSFTFDSTAIVSYAWTIQYTYGTVKTITGSGTTINIVDTCGQTQATDDGAANPLSVSLTITDAKGNVATASAGSGNQPAMQVRLFNCGL